MKKVIRIIAVLVMAALISTLLCSCIQLDDLKNNCAVWADENHSEILFRDNLYKRIQLKGEAIIQNKSFDGVLTEPDVPILLSKSEGDTIYFDKTADVPIFIQMPDKYGSKAYSCLESEYDKISEINSNNQYDSMYIRYDKRYDDEDMVGYNWDYRTEYEIIDEAYQEAIDRTLENTDEMILDDHSAAYYSLEFQRCDSEMLITNNDTIHIERRSGEYYVQDSNRYIFKQVSPDDKDIFRKLFDVLLIKTSICLLIN